MSIKHSLFDLVALYTEPASMRHRITKKLVQTKDTTFSLFQEPAVGRSMSVLVHAFVLQATGLLRHSLLGVSSSSTCQNLPKYLCWARLVPETTEQPGYELAPWSACICNWVVLILTDISGLDFRGAGVKVWTAKSHVSSYSSRASSVLPGTKQIN